MAAAANHSPRNSGGRDPSAALNSPRSKRGTAARGAGPPWPQPQAVRGAESEPFPSSSAPPSAAAAEAAAAAAAASSPSAASRIANYSPDRSPSKAAAAAASSSSSSFSSPDHSAAEAQTENYESNASKKQVWNKPSNGAIEVGAVMGAVSWPALSESTRSSPKLSSSDSFKALSDGSVPASQGTGIASSSTQSPVITNNPTPSVTPNHVIPARHKPMRRGGGSSSGNPAANGVFPQPPPPLVPVVEMPSNNVGRSGLAVPEASPRDHMNKESGQRGGFGSQSHGGNDHQHQRNSFRRGNGGGPYPRGDSSYHQNYRGRRDQDGGNHEWNSYRSFSGRDAHMHPQRVVPRFMRPTSHSATPFIPPPPPPPVPMQPFGPPMVYSEVPPPHFFYVPAATPDSLRGVPVVPQMPLHAMFFPMPDSDLRNKIVTQIDYYFSNENLIKDTFLRQKMDDQGWVPISLIASFHKVMLLTDSIPLILDALRLSSKVEVKDEKVRRRDDWWRWIMRLAPFQNDSSPRSLGRSSHDMLAANFQSVSLENRQGQDESFLSRSSSGELSSQSQRSSGDGQPQATVQAGERFISERSSSK